MSRKPGGALAVAVVLVIVAAPTPAQQPRVTDTLDEIVVTATRVATDLQKTPVSVAVLTAEQLDVRGIDAARDLGIMMPNVVIQSGPGGELFADMRIRGLPGITTYLDGVWIENAGLLQRSFVEVDHVEVLRGPQGTLFGRNTNGGAIQFVTRPPADELGARFNVELGDFGRRAGSVAVDVPLSEQFTTKWTVARDVGDGFIESRVADFAFGDQSNSLVRADLLWRPSERFSLRFNVNEDDRAGAPARVIRISNPQNPAFIAYNVLAGNPDYLARARLVDPAFPNPPLTLGTDRFTAETHEPGFPGGQLGRWETRGDTYTPTEVEQRFSILQMDWRIGERLTLESSTAWVDHELFQIATQDGSELEFSTELRRDQGDWATQELHLVGEHFDGRLRSWLGLYYHDFNVWVRNQSWWYWDFAIPNGGPSPGTFGPPGVGGRPLVNTAALNYVRAWGATVGNPMVANFTPQTFVTTDRLFRVADTDRAFFGQVTVAATDKLDVTVGFRYTTDDGSNKEYSPADSLRSLEPGAVTPGDPYAVAAVISAEDRRDFGTVSTPKLSLSYELTDEVFLYASYAEGFTSSTAVTTPATPQPVVLDPEVIATREVGVRSDWLDNRLRINATYFNSRWDGLRVAKRPPDPGNPGQLSPFVIPTSDGLAEAEGLELELAYAPGDRWQLDFALGLLDTQYLDIGVPAPNGSGLQPGIPFAYAPETSYSVALSHRWPLMRDGTIRLVGSYGWMDEYQRSPLNEFQPKNPDGSSKPEPAYGILNAHMVYEPARGKWQIALFGRNLTDEWYINGGLDVGLFQGFDFATVGRRRELGVGFRVTID
jgi:iron complex outermembrane receptor protein